MDQAQVMKRKREDWSRLYHKMLKGLEMMIDVQRLVLQLKPLVLDRRRTLYRVYTRELNREFCTGLSTLYMNT